MSAVTFRAARGKPCSVCGSESKNCAATDDAAVFCRAPLADRPGWKLVSDGDEWRTYRREDDDRNLRNGQQQQSTSSGPVGYGDRTFDELARSFAKNMTAERRAMLAKELKLPTSALEAIPLLGWINHGRDEEFYSFPEMNASGRVIGIMRRFRQKPGEKAAEKKAMLGGKRGLTIPIGWRDLPGPVFAPEGQSNSAALSACGLAAIGRPSNSGGVDFLEQLFRPLPADRSLILVGDNDKKPHSDEWPGKEGAETVAKMLTKRLSRPVVAALPPAEFKDVRDWLIDLIADAGETIDLPACGRTIRDYLEQAATTQASDASFSFRFIDSTALAGGDFKPRWVVKNVLVEKQPGVVAGPSKGLKTNLTIDLAISIAAGVPFLGKFDVPQSRRVAVVSGESGASTIQETAARICAAKGLNLADLGDRLVWCFEDLPTFSDIGSMTAFAERIASLKAEVVPLDPTYLMLGDVDARNLFEMGAAFRVVAQTLIACGATPILLHHANRQIERGRPMELTDLAYSGLEQFVRQFILINRRTDYADDGTHDLWLRFGGSHGHGGLWNAIVAEGLISDQFNGRRWEVEIRTADDVKADRVRQRASEAAIRHDRDRQAILDAIDQENRAGKPAASRNRLRGRTGFNATKVRELVEGMVEDGLIEEFEFEATVGQGGKRRTTGWRRPV